MLTHSEAIKLEALLNRIYPDLEDANFFDALEVEKLLTHPFSTMYRDAKHQWFCMSKVLERAELTSNLHLARAPASWELRRLFDSINTTPLPDQELRDRVTAIVDRHRSAHPPQPTSDYSAQFRADEILLVGQLLAPEEASTSELLAILQAPIDPAHAGVEMNSGIFDSFARLYAFNLVPPLQEHPLQFMLLIRSQLSEALPETDERLLWREGITDEVWTDAREMLKRATAEARAAP